MNTTQSVEQVLKDALKETGVSLNLSAGALAAYMHERAVHLAASSGQPGYEQALRAERNNVAMKAGLLAGGELTKMDERILGIIQGALAVLAAAI